MSGYMVTSIIGGVKGFFMVNCEDPEKACEQVLLAAGRKGKYAEVLTPLSDETLAYHEVQPNEPWLCFTTGGNKDEIVGNGLGVFQTAFSDNVLEDVGRGELRLL